MPTIADYPIKPIPDPNDRILGTDVPTGKTKNFLVSALGLSTAERTKLTGIAPGAQVNTVNSVGIASPITNTGTSLNPVIGLRTRSLIDVFTLGANFSVSSGTTNTMVCNTKAADTFSEYDATTGVLTLNHNCHLLVTGLLCISNPPNQQRMWLYLADNLGTELLRLNDVTKSGPTTTPAADLVCPIQTIIIGTAGSQYKIIYVQMNAAGTAQTFLAGDVFHWLKIVEIL